MNCCNNPDIVSSIFTDSCRNCGWYQSYVGDCESGVEFNPADDTEDYEEKERE